MSKRQNKSQASSAKAAAGTFGTGFGASSSTFATASSQLSYVSEPPDLSSISDPNVVVYFRNLSKKDSTTKAKALEDLQSYMSALQEPVEEGILEVWVKMFPRASIDNAKAVCQLAFNLHGLVAASAGKRVAKYMSKSVGAWLCGLYDSDRSVVEAAQNSLRQVFNTTEKIQNIRKAFQQSILEYCRDAIDKETVQTLSDERTTSPDDAEAKYSRVVSSCIALLGSLLANLSAEELSKHQSSYETLLANTKVWGFSSHNDASIRRALHRFLKTCVTKQPDAVQMNLEDIAKSYLSVALNSNQSGSAYDYIEGLVLLTSKFPSVWTEHYTSKTAVERRLRQFVKKGSQTGPREYWSRLVELFRVIPEEILPKTGSDAAELLNALHGGIIKKDESRLSLESALNAYLDIMTLISKPLSPDEQRQLHTELVLPLISQFVNPTTDNGQWNVPPAAKNLVARASSIGAMPTILQSEWPRIAQKLIENLWTSAPEQSKDYHMSQESVILQAKRLATIQDAVFKPEGLEALKPIVSRECASIVKEALNVLKTRNGKPYGAAGAVAELLHVDGAGDARLEAEGFVKVDLPPLIVTPSSAYLVDILCSLSGISGFEDTWKTALNTALRADDSPSKTTALEALLTSSRLPPSFDLAVSDLELQKYLEHLTQEALAGSLEWDSLNHLFKSKSAIFSSSTTDNIMSSMTQSLSLTDQAPSALQGFRQIIKSNPSILKTFVSTPSGTTLLGSLLLASESPDEEIAQEATAVNASIQTLLSSTADSKQSIYGLIQHGLREASPTSISVETLLDLAKGITSRDIEWDEMKGVFPEPSDWDVALGPFLETSPRASLAITNPLAGAVYLARSKPQQGNAGTVSRDADGYSPAFRMAQYVTKLLAAEGLIDLSKINIEVRRGFLKKTLLTAHLATDNLGLAGANNLWTLYNTETEADVTAFLSNAKQFIREELKRQEQQWAPSQSDEALLPWVMESMLASARSTAKSYYAARASSDLIENAIELMGWNNGHNNWVADMLKATRKASKETGVLPVLGFLDSFKEPLAASKLCERFCNEIIADLTGLDVAANSDTALQQLILLNNLIYGQEGITQSIAKQRLIFFVKHVVPWLEQEDIAHSIRAELCRALCVLLPLMGDIYGEHWSQILHALAEIWAASGDLEDEAKTDSPIPLVHASLKLYAQLRTLTTADDPNDDLVEAWQASEQEVAAGLVNLLKHAQRFPDEFHQPLKIVNDLLARQLSNVSLKHLESSEELFPLLYVESQPVQQTAFDILHKQIPAAQEKISIDAALDKVDARLPEELLSLILEAPCTADFDEMSFERNIPLALRGYMLSWLLIFDHLKHSSFKVKIDYVNHLKEGDHLPGLLNFTFDFLGHAHNKPVDVSKLDITSYTPDVEPPRRDAQWLLTHLYYLCLKYIPSLTKAWWIDCKSRPIVVTLEPWTEKNISPPVVAAALQSVSEWAEAQASEDPDTLFIVRVSPRAREITASYSIDEQTMAMRIALPPAFPLANAHIDGINRVAVNEQKWQSWMRTSLGAITLFNGSLIDALTTFKRNVDGAVKGKTECAICYSIVSSDKRLPDKRCSTCKNLFHGSCLFKWFKSSGASSCPLCRNPFNYG